MPLSHTDDRVLISIDSRGCTNLSAFSRNGRFLGRVLDDGTIILEPVSVVTPTQERLNRNPHTIAAIRRGHECESAPVVIEHPSA